LIAESLLLCVLSSNITHLISLSFITDDSITEEACDPKENEGRPTRITKVGGEDIDPDYMYRVATKISDLTNGQSPTLTQYYTQFPELLPSKGNYINIQGELMAFFARNLWHRLWEASEAHLDEEVACCDLDDCNPAGRLNILDRDGDGIVTVEDIHLGLRDFLGLSVSSEEMTLAEYVHSFADTNGDGEVNLGDFEYFCKEDMPTIMANAKWQKVFPEPLDPEDVPFEALQRDEGLQVV
jgi:Ca2+-binding EF-hand superfamily protein